MKLLTLFGVILVFTLAAEAKQIPGPLIPCSFMSGCPPGLTLDTERCQCVLPPCPDNIIGCPLGSYLNKECECETDDCSRLSADVCTEVKCACGKYCGLGTVVGGIPLPNGQANTSPYCAACGCCSTYSPPGPTESDGLLRPVPADGPAPLREGPAPLPEQLQLERRRPCSGPCPNIFLP